MQPGDSFGVVFSDLFDLDAAFGRHHGEVQLGGTVQGEAGVVLLGDVSRLLDPKAPHDVALYVQAQDVAGVLADLGQRVGELHASSLAPATGLDLGLDDDGVAEPLGRRLGLGHGVGYFSR